jgi:predicted AlkP superfamily phosphohydrolase/phosphomutase
MSNRTLLIGLDGATFDVLDPLMRDGVMPFLKTFVESGVRAELRTVIPPLTPPAWTSLMTGRSPGQHGVFDFFLKESADSAGIRLATSRDIHTETIWSIASRHGQRSTVLNFPLMFPPPKIEGYVVPGWMPWRQLRLGCHPEGLYDRLKALPGFNPREMAMDMELEEKAIEGCPADEYEDWIAFHTRREEQWFQVLRHLMQEDPCQLTAILLDGLDKLQHLLWRFIDPASLDRPLLPWEEQVRERCLGYYGRLDQLVAEMAGLIGAEATVVMASDHGFGAQTGTFYVNTWLEQQGYLAWAEGQAPQASDSAILGIGQLARHTYLLDWERTTAYASTPSSNGIHIVSDRQTGATGVPAEDYERFRSQLVDELLTYTDPATGKRVVSHAWTRDEAFDGPLLDRAPDITLELYDGGLFSILASEAPFQPRAEPTGTHRPEGVFLARGPGLRHGARLSQLSILDVAPLLLYSLGLPIPESMEGRVPVEALEPETLQDRPVEITTTQEATIPEPPTGPVLDRDAEEELMRRLRALGYVE